MEELLSASIRILACSFTLALLPLGVVPRMARFAFGIAALVWHLGAHSELFFKFIAALNSGEGLVWSWQQGVGDAVLGIAFGLALALPAFALELFAAQLSLMLKRRIPGVDSPAADNRSLRTFVLLLGAITWFAAGQSAELIFALNALAAVKPDTISNAVFLRELLLAAAKGGFGIGLLLLLPFYVLSLGIDFSFVVAKRYFAPLVSAPFVASTRFLLLLLLLTLSLYRISDTSLSGLGRAKQESKAQLIKVRSLEQSR